MAKRREMKLNKDSTRKGRSTLTALRMPDELYERIHEHRQHTGELVSELLRRAVLELLDRECPDNERQALAS